MATVKRIVCLANSRKQSGRCIAGKEWATGYAGAWVRPVSGRPGEEVSEYERQYPDGGDPRVLDIVDVALLEPRPKTYQQENWLLDPEAYWTKVGRLAWSELATLADPAEPLWRNGFQTFHGINDRVPLNEAQTLQDSLRLLRVQGGTLSVFSPGAAFGNPKRRVLARFRHAGDTYCLRVTDPVFERAFLAKPDGQYPLGDCYLTVSLGEPYDGFCYKLVAAIIERDGGNGP